MLDIDWELLFRYCGGECTPADRARFDDWLAADPHHRQFFDAVVAGASQALEAPPTPASPVLPIPLRVLPAPRSAGRSVPWRAGLVGLGVAAAVIIAVRTGLVGRLAGTGPRAVPEHTLATRPGERAQVDLSDGTRIVLAAGSRLRYPAFVDRTPRTVWLEGEAVFTVAHDSARPFVVRVGNAVIQDVGTRFDVRAYADDRPVRVVVAEGSVDVRAGDTARAAHRLDRGQLGQLGADGAVVIRTVDPAPYLDWAEGKLSFDATPMRDVAARLTLWYGTPVVIADSALAGRDFSGAFTDQPLRDVLDVVAAAVHARVEWRADTARLASRSEVR